MKKLSVFVVCIVCLGLVGCAGKTINPIKPTDCADSLIYKYIPEPQLTGALLVTGTQFMTVKFPQAKKYVVLMFQEMQKMLSDDKVTYAEFAKMLQNNISWINEYFESHALVSTLVMLFIDKPVPITACDTALLKQLVEAELKALQ